VTYGSRFLKSDKSDKKISDFISSFFLKNLVTIFGSTLIEDKCLAPVAMNQHQGAGPSLRYAG